MKPISLEKFQQHVANGDRVGYVLYGIRPDAALSDAEAAQRRAAGEKLKMVDGWHQPLSDEDRAQIARDEAAEAERRAAEAAKPKLKSADERIAELAAQVAALQQQLAARAPVVAVAAAPEK